MAERTPRTPEQKAASAAKAKETRARNKKVKSAVTAVESKSVVGKVPLTAQPHLTAAKTPLATPIRGSKDIEKEAERRKTEYEGIQARKAERAESGYTPTSEAKFVGPTTTSEGTRLGPMRTTLSTDPGKRGVQMRGGGARFIVPTTTRGHGATAEHVRQLEANAGIMDVSTDVRKDVQGQIRGLSSTSPVEPPHPTILTHKGEPVPVLYTNEYDRSAPIYRGQSPSSADFEKWGVGGRPDLLDVVQQHQQIATPGGINRGGGDVVSGRVGARGAFSGMNPEALERAVKAEVLPDRTSARTSQVMRPSTFNRARQVAKPYGLAGGGLTPAQKEMTDTVRVSKGGRTTTMSQAEHQERAEKRIAKRKKAEKAEGES